MLARHRLPIALHLAGLLLLLAASAGATLARAIALPTLIRQSQLVVRATPLDAQSHWESIGGRRRIVTTTRVRVDGRLDGGTADAELLVRTLGGSVGKTGQIVLGEAVLSKDESCVLFLGTEQDGAHPVMGMAQGHYPVRTGTDGVQVLARSPRLGEIVGDGAVTRLVGKPLSRAIELVAAERKRAH